MTGLTPMVLLLLKASALLLAALAAGLLLRRRAAADRHRLWSATFAGLLALPLLAFALPGLRIPLPAPRPRPAVAAERPAPMAAPAEAPRAASVERRGPSTPSALQPIDEPVATRALPSLRSVALVVWLAGVLAALAALLTALLRAHRVAWGAEAMDDAAWRESTSDIAGRLGMRRTVRVLASPAVQTPMAGGFLRPTVFVPPTAREWPDELRAMVLAHEIAHLAGRDPLRKVLGRAALTLYWFHPLAWIAARQAAAACEQACDETVLALGVRPSAYAGALLHFADAAPAVLAGAALPIVRRSSLEARLMAILNAPTRPAARRGLVLPTVAAAAVTVCIAAAQPSATPRTPAAAPLRTVPARNVAAHPVAPVRAVTTDPTPSAPIVTRQESCWSRGMDGTFSGTVSMSDDNGVSTIYERSGRAGSEVIVQRSFGDLRICARAEGLRDDDALPSTWANRAGRVVLETDQRGDVRQMNIVGGQATYAVNGAQRGVDASAQAWQSRLLALLDATWELSQLRGQESSLRGQISSIHGQRSSLQGEISSLHGEVSSMRGRIASLRGEESSLSGRISSIRGHLSSLQGQISSEQGAISSLTAGRDQSGADSERISRRVAQHREAIRELEEEIRRYDVDSRVRAVEREMASLDVDRQVEAIERQIAQFNLDSRVADVNRRIAALRVDESVAAIERQITALDSPRRIRALEARVAEALERLRAELR
ncbi:MAG TPA: M56 family metallopeptidase [Longimicrobium sp.]|jgi:beta-lactamase regulating signal transducer with metallopeptidase domain